MADDNYLTGQRGFLSNKINYSVGLSSHSNFTNLFLEIFFLTDFSLNSPSSWHKFQYCSMV